MKKCNCEKCDLCKRVKRRKLAAKFVASALVGSLLSFFALCLCGCVYKGAKVVEGTDLAIGLNVPMSEGCLQLQALNYLNGFRLGVDRNANLALKYTVAETNSYLGVVTTRTYKTFDAAVEPVAELPDPVGISTNATATVEEENFCHGGR